MAAPKANATLAAVSARPSLRHLRHPARQFFTRINEKTRKNRMRGTTDGHSPGAAPPPDPPRTDRGGPPSNTSDSRWTQPPKTARGGPPGWAAPKPCPAPWGGAPGAELVPPTEDGAPSTSPRADSRAYAWYCQRTSLRHRRRTNLTRRRPNFQVAPPTSVARLKSPQVSRSHTTRAATTNLAHPLHPQSATPTLHATRHRIDCEPVGLFGS